MSEISKRLQAVRAIAQDELNQLTGQESELVESILVSKSRYLGHRFKTPNYMAEWHLAEDQLVISDRSHENVVKSIDLANISDREIVWPNAA